jgi:hypothetical protein
LFVEKTHSTLDIIKANVGNQKKLGIQRQKEKNDIRMKRSIFKAKHQEQTIPENPFKI